MALCRVCYEKEATTVDGLCLECVESLFTKDKDLSDEEYDELVQESYDNLVRSLIEAGGEIRVARKLLTRSLEMLYLLGYDSSFTNSAIDTLTKDIKEFLKEVENE